MFNSESNFDNGWWIILLFLVLFGGNGFGGYGATQGALTRADINEGFATNSIQSGIQNLSSQLCGIGTTIMQGDNQILMGQNSNANAITNQLNNGFNGVQSSIAGLSSQLSSCCCDLKTAMLQDKYDALRNEYNLAQIASANAVQTQNILGQLGKWYSNPSVNPCNPYLYANYNYAGTTIS